MTNEQKAKELAINVMANRHFESNDKEIKK